MAQDHTDTGVWFWPNVNPNRFCIPPDVIDPEYFVATWRAAKSNTDTEEIGRLALANAQYWMGLLTRSDPEAYSHILFVPMLRLLGKHPDTALNLVDIWLQESYLWDDPISIMTELFLSRIPRFKLMNRTSVIQSEYVIELDFRSALKDKIRLLDIRAAKREKYQTLYRATDFSPDAVLTYRVPSLIDRLSDHQQYMLIRHITEQSPINKQEEEERSHLCQILETQLLAS